MKKLLTILTSISAVFLIATGIMLAKSHNSYNLSINYNFTYIKRNRVEGDRLVEIGYYQWNGHKRIEQISPRVKIIAAQLPPEITSLRNAFAGARHNIIWETKWDTSNVTDMNSLFYNRHEFNNPDILEWDTSNVTDMGEMFTNASAFNQNISKWKVPKVKNMKKMFKGATSFTHDLTNWEVSNNVDSTDFGLDIKKQPKWKKEEKVTTSTSKTTQPIESKINESSSINSMKSTNSKIQDSTHVLKEKLEEPKPITKPESSKTNEIIEKENITPTENNFTTTPNSTTSTESNVTTTPNRVTPTENILTIPSAKSGSKGKTSSNTGVIIGSVLGTTTVLGAGTGAGFGYYYRKNLKDIYFNIKKRWFKSK
ncbi:BspA family leucine-rich repeat surface protein [Mycoplasma capricolum]|uniref:BspA family leucine-rich repeat surface protein n=1 Tax=Mycoplasma capricolum TaxID=2095 RepID=UPI003DA691E5